MASKEEHLAILLAAVPDKHDKLPGSFIFDALAPVAEKMAEQDDRIEEVKDKLSIDNLSGAELTQRVRERTGQERRAGTRSKGSVTVTGTGTIRTGDLFETPSGTQFRSTESKDITSSGMVMIEALVEGPSGNVPANTITLFPVTLAGFTAVTNPYSTADGFAEESDTDLRKRYYEHIRTPASSGNKAHFRNWAKEVAGVGDARVIPLWAGNNTVKVVIIDSDRKPASNNIVAAVQKYIDPGANGKGEGAAPIGAFATVASATGVTIDIQVTAVLTPGFSQQQAIDGITSKMTQYLRDAAFVETLVSYAKVGALILDTDAVADYTGLTINGGTSNILIGNTEVAVLGTVNVIV